MNNSSGWRASCRPRPHYQTPFPCRVATSGRFHRPAILPADKPSSPRFLCPPRAVSSYKGVLLFNEYFRQRWICRRGGCTSFSAACLRCGCRPPDSTAPDRRLRHNAPGSMSVADRLQSPHLRPQPPGEEAAAAPLGCADPIPSAEKPPSR